MDSSGVDFKLGFASAVPALMVLLSLVRGDHWADYAWVASGLIVGGGICLGSMVDQRYLRFAIAIVYVIALEVVLIILP